MVKCDWLTMWLTLQKYMLAFMENIFMIVCKPCECFPITVVVEWKYNLPVVEWKCYSRKCNDSNRILLFIWIWEQNTTTQIPKNKTRPESNKWPPQETALKIIHVFSWQCKKLALSMHSGSAACTRRVSSAHSVLSSEKRYKINYEWSMSDF